MTGCETSQENVGIFRIIDKLVFKIVNHLDHIVVYELDVKVI